MKPIDGHRCEALAKAELEIAKLRLDLDAATKQHARLAAKLDAVKSAHPMVSDAGQREHCGACVKPWPCPTIRALDTD